jgi:hypothetical protein
MAIKRWNASTSQWELVGTPGTATPSAIGAASIANTNTFTGQNGFGLAPVGANRVTIGGTSFTLDLHRYNSNTGAIPGIEFKKSLSDTAGAHSAISSTAPIGRLTGMGSDGTNFVTSSQILFEADGTVSTGVIPGKISFSTVNSSGTLLERMRIDANGNVSLAVQGHKVLIGASDHTYTVSPLSIRNPIASGATLNYAIMINDPNTNTAGGFNLIGFSHNSNDYSAANVRASIGATINGGGQGSLVFRTGGYGSQAEAFRIDQNGNAQISNNGVDTLRYFDIYNTHSGNSAGTIIRLITNNAANTAVSTVDMVKYRNGTFLLANNDTGATAIFQFNNAGAERMRIDGNGSLLVGYTGTNSASYKLQVNSQIFATSSSIATSDGRYKENVLPISSGLDIIDSLNPVSFDWKDHPVHNFVPGKTVGFIAQEVQEALSDYEWVDNIIKTNTTEAVLDEEGNEVTPAEEFLGIAESNIIPLLVAAVKELRAEVNTLKAQISN